MLLCPCYSFKAIATTRRAVVISIVSALVGIDGDDIRRRWVLATISVVIACCRRLWSSRVTSYA